MGRRRRTGEKVDGGAAVDDAGNQESAPRDCHGTSRGDVDNSWRQREEFPQKKARNVDTENHHATIQDGREQKGLLDHKSDQAGESSQGSEGGQGAEGDELCGNSTGKKRSPGRRGESGSNESWRTRQQQQRKITTPPKTAHQCGSNLVMKNRGCTAVGRGVWCLSCRVAFPPMQRS